jgi:Zn finger protein HypA/HybF involved in hydrogenase expression
MCCNYATFDLCVKIVYYTTIMAKKLTTEQFIERAQKKHGNRYGYSRVVYERYDKNIEIECFEHGFFWQTPSNHLKGSGCPKCAIIKKVEILSKSTEQFIKGSKETHGPDTWGYSRVIYKNTRTDVELECFEHGFFWQNPNKHVKKGYGCPKCAHKKKSIDRAKSTEQFIEDAKKINGPDTWGYSRVIYKNNRTNVELECFKHGFFWQTPNNHLKGKGCPKCNASKGEKIVGKFLEEHSIQYIPEHKFPDCKDKGPLKFDFYIPDLNLCIEYDGEHHYRPVNYSGDVEVAQKRHEDTVRCDKIKKEYCQTNKIHLINIPYSINDIPEYIKKQMKKKRIKYEFA